MDEVFKREVFTDQEYAVAIEEGLQTLALATGGQYDELTPFEFFAQRQDGAADWRAYAHVGIKMYRAIIIDRSGA